MPKTWDDYPQADLELPSSDLPKKKSIFLSPEAACDEIAFASKQVTSSGYWYRPPTVSGTSATTIVLAPSFQAKPTFAHERVGHSLHQVLALPTKDQLWELLTALAVSKVQLAEILGVTRPTIYDWLNGIAPHSANAQRIAHLLRLLTEAGISSAMPIKARFLKQGLEEGSSVLDLLRAERIDDISATKTLKSALALSLAEQDRQKEREAHLLAQGFQPLSDEQSKEILATNMALRAWPQR